MARSRKKTVSQKVVGVATTGLPQPVRKFAGNRWIAFLIVGTVGVLLVTGVAQVRWENGRPTFSVDKERASEVQAAVEGEIGNLKDQYGPSPSNGPGLPEFGKTQLPKFDAPRLPEFGQRLFHESGQKQAEEPAFRPLSTFRDVPESQRR